jgi:hypothetical protein
VCPLWRPFFVPFLLSLTEIISYPPPSLSHRNISVYFPQLSLLLNLLSRVWVTMDGVLIGNWICWALTDRNYAVNIALSLIHTLYNSLQYALSIFSLFCLHQSFPGNGFQRRTFPLLWGPELSPFLSCQLLTLTAHNDWSAVLWLTYPLTNQLTSLHCTQLHCTSQESESHCDWRSVSLSVLVFMTRY